MKTLYETDFELPIGKNSCQPKINRTQESLDLSGQTYKIYTHVYIKAWEPSHFISREFHLIFFLVRQFLHLRKFLPCLRIILSKHVDPNSSHNMHKDTEGTSWSIK